MAQSIVSSIQVPTITEADLIAFHIAHFATASLEHFSTNFLGAIEGEEEEEEEKEDDGLGCYPDGVKRTLTDEQIAMFRHSEIEALRRERRHAEEARNGEPTHEETRQGQDDDDDGQIDEDVEEEPFMGTEYSSSAIKPQQHTASNNGKKGKRRNKKGGLKQNPKPDLRKRTWDKVDQGLGSLDYGEDETGIAMDRSAASGRRQISYDDV